MTGREILAAVRPLEQWAGAITRLSKVAQEAIRLEEGFKAADQRLTEARAAVAQAKAELITLRDEHATLATRMAAEQKATLQAIHDEALVQRRQLTEELAQRKASVASIAEQERDARAAFERTKEQFKADEAVLRGKVADLRSLAERMARSAEAVLR